MAHVDFRIHSGGNSMLKLETKSDLDRLIEEDIQQSLTLDYKDARALEKTDQKRNELCKDVSAFANSAGGQIIYGIQENGHHPFRVQDVDAVSSADISREWVEQVIDSNVQPRIQNLRIHPMDVESGRVKRTDADGIPQKWFMRRISTPPEPPIFKEADFDLTRSSMCLGFHSQLLTSNHRFRITTLVQTPGYSASEHWTILQQRPHLQLLEPGHPRAR